MNKFTLIISVPVICLFFISGCACGPKTIKKFISPAQAAYEQADLFFQSGLYPAAIAAYEAFVKNYPQHKLAPGASLGLAWTHYLSGEYKETTDALAGVRTQDKNLKAWCDTLRTEAIKRLSSSSETGGTTLFNIPEYTNQDTLSIEGTIDAANTIKINGQAVGPNAGFFRHNISLAEGENTVTIETTDKEGNLKTKTAKVVLDKTRPTIIVNSAELDDFGYVELKGTTKPGSSITAESQPLAVDAGGNFSGRINCPRNKQIKLAAVDRAGNSAEVEFVDNDYPGKPAGLSIRKTSGTTVELGWDSSRETDVKGYNVYYSTAGEFSDEKNNRQIVENTNYEVLNLRSGKTYTLYIRAVDKMLNESPKSESVTAVVP